MKDYAANLVATAAATIAAAGGVVVESAVNDGVSKTTGWALGIIAGGSAVFGWFWKQYQAQQKVAAEQRRQADDRLLEQNEALEAEVLELQAEVRDLYRQIIAERTKDV